MSEKKYGIGFLNSVLIIIGLVLVFSIVVYALGSSGNAVISTNYLEINGTKVINDTGTETVIENVNRTHIGNLTFYGTNETIKATTNNFLIGSNFSWGSSYANTSGTALTLGNTLNGTNIYASNTGRIGFLDAYLTRNGQNQLIISGNYSWGSSYANTSGGAMTLGGTLNATNIYAGNANQIGFLDAYITRNTPNNLIINSNFSWGGSYANTSGTPLTISGTMNATNVYVADTAGRIGYIDTYFTRIWANMMGTAVGDSIEIGSWGNITPATNNTNTLGNATNRWSAVHTVLSYVGDQVFSNDWVISEDGDALVFRNPDGEVVLVLHEDKVYGDVRSLNEWTGH